MSVASVCLVHRVIKLFRRWKINNKTTPLQSLRDIGSTLELRIAKLFWVSMELYNVHRSNHAFLLIHNTEEAGRTHLRVHSKVRKAKTHQWRGQLLPLQQLKPQWKSNQTNVNTNRTKDKVKYKLQWQLQWGPGLKKRRFRRRYRFQGSTASWKVWASSSGTSLMPKILHKIDDQNVRMMDWNK